MTTRREELDNLVGCCKTNNSDFMRLWTSICMKQYERETEWIKGLRANGVKASHPDDGWVDREKNEIHLCYPQFNDGLKVGDRLALGTHDKFRIVEVTGYRKGLFGVLEYWSFRNEA